LVARKVARAEVRDQELTRARLGGDARGHRGGRVCASDGETFVSLREGRLVYEQVSALRKLDRGAAVGRVCAVDGDAPLQVGAAEVGAVEGAAVRERDALAAFELSVERARRDAQFARALN